MARCKACGTEAAATARFCSICGAAVAAPTPPPASAAPTNLPPPPRTSPIRTTAPTPTGSPAYGAPQAPASNGNGKTALWIGSGLLVVCAAGFLFAKSSGLLGAKSPGLPQSQVLAAPATQAAPAPVLGAPGIDAPKSPVMSQPDPIGSPMPEDIIAYLRWLKDFNQRFEKAHSTMVSNLITSAIPDITKLGHEVASGAFDEGTESEDPSAKNLMSNTSQTLDQSLVQLNNFTLEFRQKTPPNPCAPLATAYLSAMTEKTVQTAKMVGIIKSILDSYGNSSEGASKRQDMSMDLFGENARKSMSKRSDELSIGAGQSLNALRDRYTQIPNDISSSNFNIDASDTGLDPSKLLGR